MEDAVRPNEWAFKALYKRGYRTWFSLYEMTIADSKANLSWWEYVSQIENAFLDYPSFLANLAAKSYTNIAFATGISTWRTIQGLAIYLPFIRNY